VEDSAVYQAASERTTIIETEIMKDKFQMPATFRTVCIILAAIGVISFILGLRTDRATAWGSYLIASYYFISLSVGAGFFLAIQSISHSGWSAAFRRVPVAMMAWIPVGAILFLIIWFGMHDLYHWTHDEAVAEDVLLRHKSPYLNEPFFLVRMIINFALWSLFAFLLLRLSRLEDSLDPADHKGIFRLFNRAETYGRVFIFVLALTFSMAAFDWIMSLEPHWYSSVFAFKSFIGAFLHGVSIITLIVFILYRAGYFPFLNKFHLHDFARYIFILSIVWGYLWFAQFIIIWYGNIPEETAYYYDRWQEGWKIIFWLQIILNWGVPFMVLLPVQTSRNMNVITGVIAVLIIGQYIDLFVEIMPPVAGDIKFAWYEAGTFLGFAGLFGLVVGTALGWTNLIPRNHPYLAESLEHEFE
jgi:hypothetical protein